MNKKSISVSSWINQAWLEENMNFIKMDKFVQKFLNINRIKKYRFDLIRDLYAELILNIYTGKASLKIQPSEHTLLEILRKKFLTIKTKEDNSDEDFQQMGKDTQDES